MTKYPVEPGDTLAEHATTHGLFATAARRKEEETLERERREREARRTASMIMAAENRRVRPPPQPGQHDTADADKKNLGRSQKKKMSIPARPSSAAV